MSDSNDRLAALALEAVRQIAAHYGLWFAETVHHCGLEKALAAEAQAGDQVTALALKRLAGGENPFAGWDEKRLTDFLDALARVWTAVDGVWFQAVEDLDGMGGAKRVNDTCWTRFAPLEALRIKAVLGLGATPGLDGLEAALRRRLHGRVNAFRIDRDGPDALVLTVVDCRVQTARRRKGLADYPCSSGGLAEYACFARAVDARLATRCLACPPDTRGPGEFCSWRFTLESA